ncbi:carbon-nitrogen hydrolase family protein [Kineosporia succinea]|uniref:Amidohydrolase n=1 Tax=Kineosporia succinea TaxID=84632 RepID=A0ABT9P7S4_9ACTN|nr:carbon-nitrogen hydrolase family protein [Kineosporia succinea]MDP9828512.1 putative amidohydrolase [Kineosporia succinea]
MSMNVAVVQSVPDNGDLDANLQRTRELVEQAVARGADLVLFPELSLTGYDLAIATDERMWFRPGDARLAPIRRAAGSSVVAVGAFVHDGPRRLIAQLLLRADAPDLLAPKTHLHGAESDVAEPGDGPLITRIAGHDVAFAICYDTAFPAHAEAAATAGAEIYVTSVLFTEGEDLPGRMASRAVDHGLFTVAANLGGHQLGQRSAGDSGIWAPDGSCVARTTGADEEILFAPVG